MTIGWDRRAGAGQLSNNRIKPIKPAWPRRAWEEEATWWVTDCCKDVVIACQVGENSLIISLLPGNCRASIRRFSDDWLIIALRRGETLRCSSMKQKVYAQPEIESFFKTTRTLPDETLAFGIEDTL